MMTHSEPPSELRPEHDRRRAARVRPGPLRIRLHRTCEGILLDISETGALVQVPTSMPAERAVTLSLEGDDMLLRLPGRVVRSLPHQVELASATLARKEYQIAVEFSEIPQDQVDALRKLIKSE